MPNSNSTTSTEPELSLADCLIRLLRRSRRLPKPAPPSPPPELAPIAWVLFGSGAAIPEIAKLFGVSMSVATKWISDGNRGAYDGMQALGALWDAVLDQASDKTRAAAQWIVDHMAEQVEPYFRKSGGASSGRR